MATLLVAGSAWAQDFTRLTADELNAKTTSHRIAIRCTQVTDWNTVYNGKGRANLPLTADMVYQWVPADNGTFYIKKAFADEYLQTTNITTFGTKDAGTVAKFTAVCPNPEGSGVTLFGGGDCHYNTDADKPYWVRLSLGSTWFNFNGNQYNGGTGVWTVQNILDLSDYYKVTINIVKDETETTETKILKEGEEITVPEYPLYDSDYTATTKTASDDQVITVTYTKVQTATVTYNYVFNEKTVATENIEVEFGSAYPDITVALPYGITGTKPEGTVPEADVVTKEITLTKEKELPFETAASADEITKWYYMRMHTNQPGFIGDIADDNSINVAWGKTAAESTLDNFLWGFVGSDAFGITVVNKGTGKQLTSTGNGNATLTDAGTSFFVANTGETTYKAQNGFCLRKSDSNNYLNANYKDAKLSHWSSADAGSTLFLYEEGTSANVTVSDAGYATVCIDYPVSIPKDVEVYTVTAVEGSSAKMTKVEGVLPENTGVIVKAAADNYDFAISALPVSATNGNFLVGDVVDTEVTAAKDKAYYVLSKQKDGVGFYKAALTDNKFKNNANKAYLPVTVQTESAARFLNFDFGTETAIESIEGAENAANAVIYDLSGRRVQKVQKGLYIVNGAKVIK